MVNSGNFGEISLCRFDQCHELRHEVGQANHLRCADKNRQGVGMQNSYDKGLSNHIGLGLCGIKG